MADGTARVLAAAQLAAAARRRVVVARAMSDLGEQTGGAVAVWKDGHLGSTGSAGLDLGVLADARLMLSQDDTTVRTYLGVQGEARVLFEAWSPPPRLLVFGADAHAAAVSQIGRIAGPWCA
ncbi:hypothetical protein [Streptomyces sp. NPDC096132]|uniref:hypothetical protein n=1 Tax=Streptomyces sp. NPDC096132 TaxID=3366075 RepID=UPI0037F3AD99